MDSILLDTNIILDIALERQPFYDRAHQLVLAALKREVALFITATTITDIYYIIRKTKGRESAWGFVTHLMDFVEVAGVDRDVIERALEFSDWEDFEDAVQASSGIIHGIDVLVTRDASGFSKAPLVVLAPEEALTMLEERRD